jgi:hypothetical protein
MSREAPERLIDRHEAFLECRAVDRPLLGYWVGGYYPGEQFPRGASSWQNTTVLRPDDVSFAAFAADYKDLYQAHRACDDDFFNVGSAYWGIPWLEAILGCPMAVAAANCRAEPCLRGLDDAAMLSVDLDASPWFRVLLRFTRDLFEFSRGRFPVCPPLLRGPGDIASSMLGGQALVTGLIDEPESMRILLGVDPRRAQPAGLEPATDGLPGRKPQEITMSRLSQQIRAAEVPARSVRLWWLGQAGFAFKTPDGRIVYADPCLSDAVEAAPDETSASELLDHKLNALLGNKDIRGWSTGGDTPWFAGNAAEQPMMVGVVNRAGLQHRQPAMVADRGRNPPRADASLVAA